MPLDDFHLEDFNSKFCEGCGNYTYVHLKTPKYCGECGDVISPKRAYSEDQ